MSTPLSQVGRYQIVDKLGQGGMGSLYLARDPAIDRLVAIKILRDDFDSQELRERFAREARSAGRLRHPNIVVVFDVGDHEGQPFIAMEYIPGETLGALIKRGHALEPGRVLDIMGDICAGLDYAHGAGIVHRDVKPANIMIDSSGVVKILDFGIAHVAESGMTKSGSVVGTLNYMSPEQVLGKPIDRRCDVFAVGAVLYELLTLRQAFPGGLQEGILNRIVNEQPVPLAELRPGLEPAIEQIVKKSLEKDPAHRYADLAQMEKELGALRTGIREPVRLGADAVTQPLVEPRPTERPQSARRDSERELLAKRRTAESEEHLRLAEAAFEAGDYQAALDSGERAALLDTDGTRALDLMARARTAMDEGRILQLVGEARAQLHEGALTAAGHLLEQAGAAGVTLHAESAAGTALARARIDLEKARERTDMVRKTMQRATGAFERQEFESAIRSANEALALDPVLTEALNLRRRAQTALERQRREQEVRLKADPTRADPTKADSAQSDPARKPAAAVQPRAVALDSHEGEATGRWRVPAAIGVLAAAAVLAFAFWPTPPEAPTVPAPAGATVQTPAVETAPPDLPADPPAPAAGAAPPPPAASTGAPAATGQPAPSTTPSPAAAPAVRPAAPARAANQPVPVNPRTFGNAPPNVNQTPTAADDAAIRQTIQRYEQALASLDPAAVRAVFPSVNARGLANQFATYSSFKSEMQVNRIQVGPNGQTAAATGLVTTTPVLKATGREATQRRPMTILLRKDGASWVIAETRPLPRPGEAGARAGDAGARPGPQGGAARRGRQ